MDDGNFGRGEGVDQEDHDRPSRGRGEIQKKEEREEGMAQHWYHSWLERVRFRYWIAKASKIPYINTSEPRAQQILVDIQLKGYQNKT